MRHYQNSNGRMVDPGILIFGAYVYAAKRILRQLRTWPR